MKFIVLAGVVALAGFANPVLASCNAGAEASRLNKAQLDTILQMNYACGRSTANNAPGWNERHGTGPGTNVTEQHNPGTTDDEVVGKWTSADVAGRGQVTYTYGPDQVYVYEVAKVADTPPCTQLFGNGCTTLGVTYQFCRISHTGPALNILVSSSLPALTSCPMNP